MNSHRSSLRETGSSAIPDKLWAALLFKSLSTWKLICLVQRHVLLSHLDAKLKQKRSCFGDLRLFLARILRQNRTWVCRARQAPMSSGRQIRIPCTKEIQNSVILGWAWLSEISSHAWITGAAEGQDSCILSKASPWAPQPQRWQKAPETLLWNTPQTLCLHWKTLLSLSYKSLSY